MSLQSGEPSICHSARVMDSAPRPSYEELLARVADYERQEQQSRLDRERLLALIDSLPEDIFLADAQGQIVLVNRTVRASLGVEHPEELATSVARVQANFEVFLPDGSPRPSAAPLFRRALGGEVVRGEEIVRHRTTGERRYREYQITPVVVDGRVAGAVSAVRDVTDARLVERALRESETRFRSIFESAPIGIVIGDAEGRVLESNSAFAKMLGFTKDELVGKSFRAFTHPEDVASEQPLVQDMLAGRRDHYEIEKRFIHKNGDLVHVRLSGSFLGGSEGGPRLELTLILDITERKRHEQELQQRNLELEVVRAQVVADKRRLEAVMDALPVGVAITDTEGGTIQCNSEFERIWGRPRPAASSLSDYHPYRAWWAETGEPLGVEEWASVQAVRREEPVTGQFLELERLDGSRVFVINSAAPVRDASGGVVGSAVTVQDVSELRHAQRALRESEERFRLVLEDSPVTVSTLDGDLRYTWVHNTRHGFVPEEVIGKRPDELISPEDAGELMTLLRHVLETGKSERREVSGKTRGVRWDYLDTAEPLEDEQGRVVGLRLAQIDITDRKRAEERLRASDERHRLALAAGRMGTWDWLLPSGEVTWNEEQFRLLGYPIGSVRPSYQAWTARVHPEDLARTEASLQASLRQGEEYLAEFRVRWPDGSVHWVEARGRVERDPTGNPLRQYGVLLDVTERKLVEEQRREEQRQLRWVLDATGLGLWLNELPLEALNWDARTRELFFIQPDEEASIELFWQRLHPDDRERTRLAVEVAIRNGGLYSIDHRAVHPHTGQVRWIRSAGQATYDDNGAAVRFDGINYDITERKASEAALKHANELLREADQRKDHFLAVLSHELRNPLAPIRNSLFVLGRVAPDGDRARRARAIIERQLSHLTRLVDDLLDATRIARGKMQIRRERLELGELMRRVLEDHRAVFAAAGIDLKSSVTARPLWILGDATRLCQAVGNLLQNAAKFTPGGGQVEASLGNIDGAAVLQVIDTGIGVAPELLERIFEPFVQADHTLDRHFGGLGLGLALAKTVVEHHGGVIEARSSGPGRGATFTVRLPLEVPESPKAITSEHATLRPSRILVIEDNVDAADTLKDVLELKGHTVIVSYSGIDGIKAAREFLPEVVLCDIGLPELDGYAVARAFRADEVLRSSALVALTGYALPEDIAKATEAGFDSHVAKPPSIERIEEAIALCRACARSSPGIAVLPR